MADFYGQYSSRGLQYYYYLLCMDPETTTTAIGLGNTPGPVCDKCGSAACRHDDDDDGMCARCRATVYTSTQSLYLLFTCSNGKIQSAKTSLIMTRTAPSYSCSTSSYDALRCVGIRRLRRKNVTPFRVTEQRQPSAIPIMAWLRLIRTEIQQLRTCACACHSRTPCT